MLEKILERYEMVCGLEVHAQLKTRTKLMSPAENRFGASPNSLVSTVCTGMPGALPTLNEDAIEMAVVTALALNCEVENPSVFSRKHYFYPDLPKGYQISQYDRPYARNGEVSFYIKEQLQRVGLERIHMEEDAGKNLHMDAQGISFVDLNRSSVPLIEIVSRPDIRSPEEAAAYLKSLRRVLRYLDVCDGNMEEGSLRCDANVSIRPREQSEFGTRVELKNINSFRNLEKAIIFEVERQFKAIESGESIVQETRLWDANKNQSRSMRSKEEASDYRYMPEPDLHPLFIPEELISSLKESLPELPNEKVNRFIKEHGRSPYDAEVLTSSKQLAQYYEDVVKKVGDPQLASSFIQTNVLALISDIETGLQNFFPTSEALADLLSKVKDKSLSLGMAKEVFEVMHNEKRPAAEIISERGLSQVSNEAELEKIVQKVLDDNPKQLEQYHAGKTKLFGFFMGQCQKTLQGKGNPAVLKGIIERKLKP